MPRTEKKSAPTRAALTRSGGRLGAEQGEGLEVLSTLEGNDRGEAVCLVLVVDHILRRDGHFALPRVGGVQIHEAVRSLEAEWLEEHAVHEAERRGAGTDRERQGSERDQGERGRACESARSVAQFLDRCFHRVDRRGGSRDAASEPVTQIRQRRVGWGLQDPTARMTSPSPAQ